MSPQAPASTALLLPGQEAAPQGPVDLLVTYAINHGVRRDAARFVEAVGRTPVEDVAAWRRLERRWDVLVRVVRVQAQGQSTGLWPALRGRCDPDERAVLDAMESEQAALASQLRLCAVLLARVARTADADARSALLVRVVATRDALLRHLRHEETDAMAVVQRHLTDAEWREIDRSAYLVQVSPRFLATLVPWTAYDLPQPVLREVVGRAGLGFRLLWWATRDGFARRERRVLDRG